MDDLIKPSHEFWSERAVCVLGGTGFLGYHLARQLRDCGARVRIFGLPPSEHHPVLHQPQLQFLCGDVLRREQVREAVAGQSIIFNLAGIVSAGSTNATVFRSTHVEAIRNAIATADPGARIVHTSSVTAVGASRCPELLNEESAFTLDRVRIDYVHAKRAAENEALAAARERDVVVVNPGYLVGPEDFDLSIMGWLCDRFWRGKVPFAPPGGLNLLDVRDAAAGHILAAERGLAGRRYILGGENCSQQEFFRLLAEVAGWRPRHLPQIPDWLLFTMAGVAELRARLKRKRPFPSFADARVGRYFWYYSSDRAVQELGFAARPLKESLADAFAWHQARGMRPLRKLRRSWFRPPEPQVTSVAQPSAK